MKKLFLLFLLLAFALPVNAFNPLLVCTGAVASGGENSYGDTSTTSNYDVYSNNRIYYEEVEVTTGGTLIELWFHATDGNSTPAKMALYDDNSGSPGSLVSGSTSGEETMINNSKYWQKFTPSGSPILTDSTTYYIAFWAKTLNVKADRPSSAASTHYEGEENLTYTGTFPATATPSTTHTYDGEYAQYIVVEY